jgi:hypothetical protein
MGTGEQSSVPRCVSFVTQCAGFDSLVEEYTRLVERLEDRQWTMKVAGCCPPLPLRVRFSRAGRRCRLQARHDGIGDRIYAYTYSAWYNSECGIVSLTASTRVALAVVHPADIIPIGISAQPLVGGGGVAAVRETSGCIFRIGRKESGVGKVQRLQNHARHAVHAHVLKALLATQASVGGADVFARETVVQW